jgi:hypothetical protein
MRLRSPSVLGTGASVEARKRETPVSLLYASKRALALLSILWRTHRLPVRTSGMSDLVIAHRREAVGFVRTAAFYQISLQIR